MFERIHSEVIYQGRVLDVRKDQVRTPSGQIINLDVILHRPAVTILPIDEQGQIWFIRQFRYSAGRELLELPAGALEEGETPEVGAQRETREEIGMAAGRLVKIGEFYLAPGYSTEYMYVFLATDLNPDPLQPDADEYLTVEKILISQAVKLAETGNIQDAKSLAALLVARPYLALFNR
jgi:ADP-ribose pyrophosphatase